MNVELGLFHYEKQADLKDAAGVDTSKPFF